MYRHGGLPGIRAHHGYGLSGGNFLDDLRKGFTDRMDFAAPILSMIPGLQAIPAVYGVARRFGLGKPARGAMCGARTQAGTRCRNLRGACRHHS